MKNGHENGINFAEQTCLAMTHSCFFEESAVPWNECFESLYNYEKSIKLGIKKKVLKY